MGYQTFIIALAFTVFEFTPAIADKPSGSKYISGGDSKVGVILAHGRGKHPAWKVVNPLRKWVSEKLGYHTLSLQMPNDKKNWKQYAADFLVAYTTINDGIRFLKEEKGVSRIFLMGHSMGSRMVSAFVSDNSDQPINGLIVAGCRNNGGTPLSCEHSLRQVDIPVLDIWGGHDAKDSRDADNRSSMVSEAYTQVSIPGANHRFDGYDDELISAVVMWLKRQ